MDNPLTAPIGVTVPKFSLPPGHKLEPAYHRPYALFKVDPSPAGGDGLLKALAPVIDKGLTSYGGRNVNPMLRSHAKRLALDAARTYDPAAGPLQGHVLNTLQGLKRYSARQQQAVSAPDAVMLDHKSLADAHRDLRDELGRDPSDGELADRSGMSPKRMAYVRQYRPGFAQGQVEGLDGEAGVGPAVADTRDHTRRRLEFLHPDLDPVDQAIVEGHLGMNGQKPRSFTAIARGLNLSNAAISQRAARIQRMVDELEDAGV